MTREEIVEGLKLLEDNMVHFDELQNDKGEWIDVHELLFEAIQALSQEPLENIREEIASHIGGCGFLNDGLDVALRIIDKHCPSCGAEMVEPQESEE